MQIAPLFLNIDGTSSIVPAEISEDLKELWNSLLEAIKPSIEQRRTIVAFTQGEINKINICFPPLLYPCISSWSRSYSRPSKNLGRFTGAYRSSLRISTCPKQVMDFMPYIHATYKSQYIIDSLFFLFHALLRSLDTEMEEVAKILSPTQIAKFILWIDQNPACIGMLETLWPHIQQNFDNF
jgi:hypothetical protein